MIKNYLVIALRKIRKQKLQSFINIFGLTLGITVASMLFIYVLNELNYDNFFNKSDRIFRVIEISETNSGINYYGQTAPALGPAFKNSIPEVIDQTRLFQFWGHINVELGEKKFHERSWFMADSNFFEVFDYKFLNGNPGLALSQPNSVVLTESTAYKYFSTINVIGSTLKYNDLAEVKITGIVQDPPENSHLKYDIILSYNSELEELTEQLKRWEVYGAYTYLVVNDKESLFSVEEKGNTIVSEAWKEFDRRSGIYLQSIEDIYLNSENIQYGLEESQGKSFYINLFLLIAISVLIIASINYINLATAQSLNNSREIGIRKSNGAERKQLIVQFLTESFVTTFISFLLSLILIDIFLPSFSQLAGKVFEISTDNFVSYFGIAFLIAVLISLLSGIYPAFYLSGLQPIKHFVHKYQSKYNLSLRRILVIAQFAVSIILIILSLAAFHQLQYIQKYDKGFNDENVLVIDINSSNVRTHFKAMKEEFDGIPGIEEVAVSSRVPGEWKNITTIFLKSNTIQDSLFSYFMCFDKEMFGLYDFKLLEGNIFMGQESSDSTKILLNEKAVEALGMKNPIGKRIRISGVEYPMTIIGVLKDFNYQSLHQAVSPMVIGYWSNPVRPIDYFSLKYSTKKTERIIKEANIIHEKYDQNTAMEFHFLSDQIEGFYTSDNRAKNLFLTGSIIAILLACIGLFGMAVNSTENRKAEIGIRKTFGSSTNNVVVLLTSDFLKLVVFSILLSIPVSYFLMDKWFQNFAYNTGIEWWLFAVSAIMVLVISFLTVSLMVIRAARINPAEILRDE